MQARRIMRVALDFYDQMNEKLNCLVTMAYTSFGVRKEMPSTLKHHPYYYTWWWEPNDLGVWTRKQ